MVEVDSRGSELESPGDVANGGAKGTAASPWWGPQLPFVHLLFGPFDSIVLTSNASVCWRQAVPLDSNGICHLIALLIHLFVGLKPFLPFLSLISYTLAFLAKLCLLFLQLMLAIFGNSPSLGKFWLCPCLEAYLPTFALHSPSHMVQKKQLIALAELFHYGSLELT